MASDTFAEVVEWLDGIAQFERIQTQSPWASPPERALHEAKAQQYAKAARLLAAAGEEVRGWRKRNAITDPRKYERALSDVVPFIEALNAIAPELENDHAG